MVVVGMMLSCLWCCQPAAAFSLTVQPELQHPVHLLCCAGYWRDVALRLLFCQAEMED